MCRQRKTGEQLREKGSQPVRYHSVAVLKIYGYSMEPGLESGDTVVAIKSTRFQRGDIAAFYYNNKILVKRVIALPGERVEIDENGVVSVNGTQLEEPYVKELSLGECDIRMPYEVPEESWFVIGDNRQESADSRAVAVGCIGGADSGKGGLEGLVMAGVWAGEIKRYHSHGKGAGRGRKEASRSFFIA